MSEPLVIAHRGASAHRPELSAGAFRLGFRLGADGVELDLVATRDGTLVVRHDLELSRTTDVAVRPEFTHLRRTVPVGGHLETGWFVHDFSVDQLRTLRCRERWPRKRAASAQYDDRYPVLTFAEALALVDGEAARRGTPLRVFAELKEPAFLESVGLSVPDLVAGFEGSHLTWLSFDPVVLRRLRLRGRTRLVQLVEDRVSGRELGEIASYASGVGVRRKTVLARDGGDSGVPTGLVAKAHRRDLDVFVWTHRPENQHLPAALRIGPHDHAHGDARREARLLFEAGIDALISDVPEIAVAARSGLAGLPIAR